MRFFCLVGFNTRISRPSECMKESDSIAQ